MLYEIRLALFDFCNKKGVSTRSWLILKLLFCETLAIKLSLERQKIIKAKKQIACQKWKHDSQKN
jgi:hypothetical protein